MSTGVSAESVEADFQNKRFPQYPVSEWHLVRECLKCREIAEMLQLSPKTVYSTVCQAKIACIELNDYWAWPDPVEPQGWLAKEAQNNLQVSLRPILPTVSVERPEGEEQACSLKSTAVKDPKQRRSQYGISRQSGGRLPRQDRKMSGDSDIESPYLVKCAVTEGLSCGRRPNAVSNLTEMMMRLFISGHRRGDD